MEYRLSIKEYAAKYHVSTKTIGRWKAESAPLDEPKAMELWTLSKEKFTPRAKLKPGSTGTLIIEPLQGITPVPTAPKEGVSGETATPGKDTAPSPLGTEKEGVAASLKRLEAAEAHAHARLRKAIAEGNERGIVIEREGWLSIGKSLREYDVLVERSRRDSGDLIPRDEAEKAVRMAATWMRISFWDFLVDVIPKITDDKYRVQRIMEDSMRGCFDSALLKSKEVNSTLEDWAITQLKKGFVYYKPVPGAEEGAK